MSETILTNKTDDVIVFNTENQSLETKQLPTFDLVPENDPILREVMPEFDFQNSGVDANAFASTMVETCKKHNGFGLSANQCGYRYRMFVMGAGDNFVAHFNPKLIKTYDETHMVEGCLSFPMLALRITRPAAVDVEYQDFNGEKRTAHYSGISARCFLHELDHMNGIVYTSRAKPMALQQGLKKRGKINHLIEKANKNLNKLEASIK